MIALCDLVRFLVRDRQNGFEVRNDWFDIPVKEEDIHKAVCCRTLT